MITRSTLLGLVGLAILVMGASHDDNIEWDGVTHIDWLDRSPLCPVDGESFEIKFQTYYYDTTSARVYADNGTASWVDAQFSHTRGPYDIWTAILPASGPTATLEYYIELTDGTDTDYFGPGGMSDSPPATGWIVNFATLSHAPLGGTLTSDGGAVFKVWAPTATTANVAGEFNGWNATSHGLDKSGDYFTGRVDSLAVDDYDQYKFVFNGDHWRPDARGRANNASDNNNSYAIDPSTYVWDDNGYQTPPFEEMVIYELHVGTFSGRNDGLNRMGRFRDIVDTHLNHLLYLGVNAIELMPINEAFTYYTSWGYNPVNNWAPEQDFGSPDDLKYTIDKLHQNGIAVILDIVFNHFGGDDNFMWWYDGQQVYFDDPAVSTPWGDQAAFWKQEVRDYYADCVLHWLEEYHVDGFRMDATRYMRNTDQHPAGYPEGWALMQRINDDIDRRKVDAISIAEDLPNTWEITEPTSAGAGFDSQWHDAFNDDMRQEVFDAGFGDPEMWKIGSAINASGYWPKTKLVRYVEAHDEAGGDGTGQDDERLAVTIDGGDPYSVWAKGRSKLAQGLTILCPGIPMFLMGGEWMEDIKFDGKWDNRIDWSKAIGRPEIVLFFRDVIGVRKSNCGMRSDADYNVYHYDDTNNVIAFHRGTGQEIVVVASLANSDLNSYQLGFPHGGTWYEILNSQASVYLGNGSGNGGSVVANAGGYGSMPESAFVTIPEMGLLVFRYEDPLGRSTDLDTDGDTDTLDYAILQRGAGDQGCGMTHDIQENGRVDGQDLAELGGSMAGPI